MVNLHPLTWSQGVGVQQRMLQAVQLALQSLLHALLAPDVTCLRPAREKMSSPVMQHASPPQQLTDRTTYAKCKVTLWCLRLHGNPSKMLLCAAALYRNSYQDGQRTWVAG